MDGYLYWKDKVVQWMGGLTVQGILKIEGLIPQGSLYMC